MLTRNSVSAWATWYAQSHPVLFTDDEILSQKTFKRLGVVACTFNPRTQEAKIGRPL